MRNTFLFLAMLLAVQLVAQMAPSPNRQPPPRPLTLLEKDSVALDSIRFRLGITAQFSKLIDPSSNTNIGNYAAVDIKDAAVTFGGSVQGSKGNIWAVKFSGAITDGVAAIWQNRELNKWPKWK